MQPSSRSAAVFLLAFVLALPGMPSIVGSPGTRAAPSVGDVLRERLEQLQMERIQVDRAQLAARGALPVLYEEAGYQPFWTPEKLGTLIALVRESAEDGLTPEDYHLEELTRVAPSLATAGVDAFSRARADLLATDAFYLLLYHLYLGKVDPKSLDAKWNFDPAPVGEHQGVDFVLAALTSGKLREAVAKVLPDHWFYARGRASLAEYRKLAERGGWRAIPPGPPLKPGATGARVVALRQRLAATGDLSGQPLDTPTYDEPLAAAVRAFQSRNHLSQEGTVGPATLRELNVPVDARILQIRVNLERARWLLHGVPEGDFVLVDVAGFQVAYIRDHKPVWEGKVQVGKPYRQTPIFKSKIDHVVFNPTWTVPPGIAAKDVLPGIKRDRHYLEKKGLDVIDATGRKVDATGIDWAAQKASTFPYMFRQAPGPDNSLGRVKIMFPNPYFAYLHDTPHKELFEKEERAFSSGCMRVERPLELAEVVLNDPEAWNASSIAQTIEAGQTQTVRLKKPIPVLIMYWTIDLSTEGRTGFKRDPYGRDMRLAQALDARLSAGGHAGGR